MSTIGNPEKQAFTLDRGQVFFALVAASQLLVLGILRVVLLGNDHLKSAELAAYM